MAFAVEVAAGQSPKDSLRTARREIVLARRQFVTTFVRVEPQGLALGIESCFLVRVLRFKTGEDPGFALHDGEPDHNSRRSMMFRACLLQSKPPFRLIVLIPDEHDAREVIHRCFQVQNRPPGRDGIRETGLPFKETTVFDLRRSRDVSGASR